MALLSRRPTSLKGMAEGERVFILANGPSLAEALAKDMDFLRTVPTMAVNFAAIAPSFNQLRPRYYVLADPHFFAERPDDANLVALRQALTGADWPMTLFVPARYASIARELYGAPATRIARFNAVGVEGFDGLCRAAYGSGLGMPRPRNVLIPSLMLAIRMGYKEIVVLGADHSWTKTLSVTDDNEVVSIQPHFYADSGEEQSRIRHEYRSYRLHTIMESFAIAFKSYHDIAAYARRRGVSIINATPSSFIDAFERRSLDDLK